MYTNGGSTHTPSPPPPPSSRNYWQTNPFMATVRRWAKPGSPIAACACLYPVCPGGSLVSCCGWAEDSLGDLLSRAGIPFLLAWRLHPPRDVGTVAPHAQFVGTAWAPCVHCRHNGSYFPKPRGHRSKNIKGVEEMICQTKTSISLP